MDNNIEKTGLFETVVGIIMDVAPIICVLIIIAWAGRAYAEGYGLFVQKSLDSPGDVQAHSEMVTISEEDAAYIRGKYARIVEALPRIDEELNAASEGWKTRRMNRVDLMLLRLALYEMKLDQDIPVSVAINEAVELATTTPNSDTQEENKDVWGQ